MISPFRERLSLKIRCRKIEDSIYLLNSKCESFFQIPSTYNSTHVLPQKHTYIHTHENNNSNNKITDLSSSPFLQWRKSCESSKSYPRYLHYIIELLSITTGSKSYTYPCPLFLLKIDYFIIQYNPNTVSLCSISSFSPITPPLWICSLSVSH